VLRYVRQGLSGANETLLLRELSRHGVLKPGASQSIKSISNLRVDHLSKAITENQLAHAVEVAKLSGILASELGANVQVAKQGGFLHDIGKAMDHNQEGTHAMLGAEFCKRYNVNVSVVNAIASHHREIEQELEK
jgi:putative nucleotidyltransferase with HDIG domain